MKKLMCLLLALSLVLGLSGCAYVTEASGQLESWVWVDVLGVETEDPEATDYVPEEGFMPKVYTYRSDTAEDGGRRCDYRIPALDMPGPAVEAINREIQQTYLSMTEPYTGGPEQALPYDRIDYKWAVKGDVLSLVVMAWGADDGPSIGGFGYDRCSVYNVSVRDCRLLESGEIYTASGIAGVENHTKSAVASRSGDWYLENGNSAQIFSEENRELTTAAFGDCLSAERLEAAMPYYDEHDRLCVIAELCDPVTEERFWADICLDDYDGVSFRSAEEYYDYFAGLAG
ncbi:MAG: hypothetical protein IJ357_09285 [Oscillospiraceae bacterium]|nr:hypothetical protein [Oscillospiraceae bacterium]